MEVEILPQFELGDVSRIRIGDFLNASISSKACKEFRFAVAFMRMSGLDRLAPAMDSLLNRGGHVSGAVGISEGITSVDALEALSQISPDSTIFSTVSGFVFHPKLYLMEGEKSATAVVGSANLTCNGLFRNVEIATAIRLDFNDREDLEVYERHETVIAELLNTSHPNIQPLAETTIQILIDNDVIRSEAHAQEPGPTLRPRKWRPKRKDLGKLFPPLSVPSAPPVLESMHPIRRKEASDRIPRALAKTAGTFVMQLSSFDTSHRTGVRGTPEVLVPHDAIPFFPPLSVSERKYPDVMFDVILDKPTGPERHNYRLWYYEERAVGSRIDEYRLRMNHDLIDLSAEGGGDLLVINKLTPGSDPEYEVTIVSQNDPAFPEFLKQCTLDAQGKKWGMT